MMERSITHEGVKYRKILRKAVLGDLITHRYSGEYDGMPRKVVEITPEAARFETYYDYTVREEVTGFIHDAYMVLEVDSVPQTGLTEMPKVGERVRYLGGDEEYDTGMHVGGIYEVTHIDEVGDANLATSDANGWFIDTDSLGMYELEAADAVNSPAHYKRGKFETIEVIEHITAGYTDPFVAYCVGNAVKYIDRAPYKHDSPAECLRKAAWYLTRAAENVEAGEA